MRTTAKSFLWVFLCSSSLFAGDTSEPVLVFLRPETSSFWRTATNRTMTLPVSYPTKASSAKLTVSGVFGHVQTIENITSSSVEVSLPEPLNPVNLPSTENIYDLKLEFDDGTVRTASLALIAGLAGRGEGSTRCIAPDSRRIWPRVCRRAVVPVPYGMTALAINGENIDTALDGAQGWCALTLEAPEDAELTGMFGDSEWAAALKGYADNITIIVR